MKAPKQILRMVELRRELADTQARSVPVVIASENPIERVDDVTGEIYREVLSMNGVRFRGKKNQLPIVDSHNRSTVRNVLGSVRNIRVEGSELVGDATFAKDAASQEAFEKLLDGHLTDFSITALQHKGRAIARGESELIGQTQVEGPAVIVTDWVPSDASLVAAGADETSTVRELLRSYEITKERKRMLSEELKTALVAKGMPEQIADAEQALTWAIGLMTDPNKLQEPVLEPVVEPVAEIENMEGEEMADEKPKEEELKDAVERALKADNTRRKEIQALCKQAKIERSFADSLCDSGVNLDKARQSILEKIMEAQKPVGAGGSSEFGQQREGRDILRQDIEKGLISRALKASGSRQQIELTEDARKFQSVGMFRMAEEILRSEGINTLGMNPKDIALVALGHRATIERMRNANIIRDAYHTTGTFSNLLLNAANKTLLAGYDEAPYTWNIWARQAPSVADFKTINRVRFSESPDLLAVPENDLYPEGVMTDSKESYVVEKFGRLFTVSWETVVNDDLDAISRIPQMHGNAARRTQNKKVYEVLTANALMGDGVALFGSHASGTNLAGASAGPSVTTLNTAFTAMALQKGLNSSVVLGITPRYLIVPVTLGPAAQELVTSMSYNAANNNSGVQNIYGRGGSRTLTVVEEAQLDGNSTTAWYAAADSGQIDTVELTFLQGEEQPVLEQEWDFDKDVYKYKVRQTFGVKAIDWRGLYKYATA